MEEQLAQGDQVAQRITAYGTHSATGRAAEFPVLQIVRAGPGGRFAEHWCSADLLTVVAQLSAPALQRVI